MVEVSNSRKYRTSFQHNGEAVLGSARNVMLVKDDVGRAKPFTHNLPSSEFAFGRVSTFDESAGEGKSKNIEKRYINFNLCVVIEKYQYRDEKAIRK